MKKLYLALLCLLFGSILPAQKYYSDTLYFSFDKFNVIQNHHPAVDSLVSLLKVNPAYYIKVIGHTDTVGSDAYNMNLSKKRALSVTTYLVSKGLEKERIGYEFKGFHNPATTNKTKAGRRINRRVNMYVVYDKTFDPNPPAPVKPKVDSVKPTPPTPPTPVKPKVDTVKPTPPVKPAPPKIVKDSIVSDGKTPVKVDCTHETVIVGPKGAKILIPNGAFKDCNDQYTFEVKEYFTKTEMVMSKMHTMSKKDAIDLSSGIVCLRAFRDGQPQFLQPSKPIMVTVPTDAEDKTARVYTTTGSGSFSWRQYTMGQDVPTFDATKKAYSVQMTELGCVTVANKCENPSKQGYAINLKIKGLQDKNPQIFYVTQDGNKVAMGKKAGSGYRIENICQPGPAMIVATQKVNGQNYLAYKEVTDKVAAKLEKKGLATAKMKFERIDENRIEGKVRELVSATKGAKKTSAKSEPKSEPKTETKPAKTGDDDAAAGASSDSDAGSGKKVKQSRSEKKAAKRAKKAARKAAKKARKKKKK